MQGQHGKIGVGEFLGGLFGVAIVVSVIIEQVGSWQVFGLITAINGILIFLIWAWEKMRGKR
jgi:hypothetical protein